jgi:uncharacterized protein YigA (DUF484 family)
LSEVKGKESNQNMEQSIQTIVIVAAANYRDQQKVNKSQQQWV